MLNKTEQEIMSGWNLKDSLSVSICCITYNHEKYIGEAIDGFLMQRTTFPFEIIIGEDYSTDSTLKIIYEYKSKYPNLIQVLKNDINIGMQKNFTKTFNACVGTYIALCEGDDFWTDPNKLQKQISFLEENSQFAICCHKSEKYNQDHKAFFGYYPNINHEKEFSLYDLFRANIANTCTFVYRNYHLELPLFFENLQVGDWPLHMIHAQHGKIKYIPESLAAYRVHTGGVWSSSGQIKKIDATIFAFKYMNKYFENQYSIQINKTISNFFLEKASYYFNDHRVFLVSRCYIYAQKYSQISFLDKVKYIVNCYFPESYPKIALFYRKINFLWQKN